LERPERPGICMCMRRRIHVRRRQWHWKVLNVLALAHSQESVEEDTLHGMVQR
jgi:hypothetical protein